MRRYTSMNDDFSNLNIYFRERIKLFIMRFKKHVHAEFLGDSLKFFLDLKFIQSHYEFTDTTANKNSRKALYSLTDRYFRYCLYRRRKFFDSKIWPFIISIISAIITAVITAYITALSVLR